MVGGQCSGRLRVSQFKHYFTRHSRVTGSTGVMFEWRHDCTESQTIAYAPFLPTQVWKERPDDDSSTNYLSGMGGYLQSLLYGYGGYRIHLETLTMNPTLPDKVHSMTFNSLGKDISLQDHVHTYIQPEISGSL